MSLPFVVAVKYTHFSMCDKSVELVDLHTIQF